MVKYIKGDIIEQSKGSSNPVIIGHICNDQGGFGKGVALAIAKRWPRVRNVFKEWTIKKPEEYCLGNVYCIWGDSETYVLNLVAQHGYKNKDNPVPLDYKALRTCLGKARVILEESTNEFHIPKIGTGLAGGDWGEIFNILQEEIIDHNIDLYIYEL